MSYSNSEPKKNHLKLHIEKNYPSEDVRSVEIFSFNELSSTEVEKVFINTYAPINGSAINKSLKLSNFEQFELSALELIKPLFLASQIRNSYSKRANPLFGTSHKPIANLEVFNNFHKNTGIKKLEDASCLEEAHAYLYTEIAENRHIHIYCDSLSDYKQETLSILESKVIYKKYDLKNHTLYEILGDLIGFHKINVPNVAIFVDMIESDKSVFILKIHDMIHFMEQSKNEDRFRELESSLVNNRYTSEIADEKYNSEFNISEDGILLYRRLLKSDLASESIDRIKSFTKISKHIQK